MGRTLFVLRYRDGEPEPLPMDAVREVLAPYVVAADEDLRNGVLIRTADGHEVDVDVNEVCVAFSRFPGGSFFDVLARLVDRLGATVIPVDRPVIIRGEGDRAHLSADIRDGAVVVATTGPALDAFLGG
ncbi:hypothetical protein ACFVZH_33800 [Streptomyces sp. NPDC059534]|uniref:hypothetical protein n=1 Tax=Streptomyces sp. NPDC059534 TaxID=3346859 RepID=UPI0036AA227E